MATRIEFGSSQSIECILPNARAVAQRYTQDLLAGFELSDYRYIVLVSWRDLEVPSDVAEGGVSTPTYRFDAG